MLGGCREWETLIPKPAKSLTPGTLSGRAKPRRFNNLRALPTVARRLVTELRTNSGARKAQERAKAKE